MVTMTAGLTVTGIPEVIGEWTEHFDGRYRVWTAAHGLDWRDSFNGPEGWILVPATDWDHVTTMGCVWNERRGGWDALDGEQVALIVTRQLPDRTERHPELDRKVFPNYEAAYDAAWAAGLLGMMIYDRHAGRRGLVDAAIAYEDQEQAAGRLALTDRKTGDGNHDWWCYDWQWLLNSRAYNAAVLAELHAGRL